MTIRSTFQQRQTKYGSTSPLLKLVEKHSSSPTYQLPTIAHAEEDINLLIRAFALQSIRRYLGQVHWEMETREALFADRAEPGIKLENVAAHSWHVADTALLLASHFSELDVGRALAIAILHDKLEIYTGDFDPIGPDGSGTQAHSFNVHMSNKKKEQERAAVERYVSELQGRARKQQRAILLDAISGGSPESRFIKGVDKLQAMAFVHTKKDGNFSDQHLLFSIRYSSKAVEHFVGLQVHYLALLNRLLDRVAERRNVERPELDTQLFSQLEMELRVRE